MALQLRLGVVWRDFGATAVEEECEQCSQPIIYQLYHLLYDKFWGFIGHISG